MGDVADCRRVLLDLASNIIDHAEVVNAEQEDRNERAYDEWVEDQRDDDEGGN